MKPLTLLLFLVPALATAQSHAPLDVPIERIISAIGPSWNPDAHYKAVLLHEGDFAALYIFRGPFDRTPLVYAPQIALTGTQWGAIPWLEITESGALLVYSENRAFGRNKWEKTLEIIEREDAFLVSKFTLSAYDSLNPADYTDCEIDFLAHTLTINGQTISPFPLPALVVPYEWSEIMEDACYKG